MIVARSFGATGGGTRMSHEGVALVARVALVGVLIVLTAVVRVLVGPSRRRGFYMGLGTLGGMTVGVFSAFVVSRWITTDISALSACAGIVAGWTVAWRFARAIPREAD
jgi:uncharacterized protein (UPF0548 family)